MRRLAMAGLAVAMLATGCVLIPIPTDLPEKAPSDSLTRLRTGTSTRADMVRMLGEPTAEFGGRQAFWSYRHEKGRIYWLFIVGDSGSTHGPFDWGRDEDLSVLATFDDDEHMVRTVWAASDGRAGSVGVYSAETGERANGLRDQAISRTDMVRAFGEPILEIGDDAVWLSSPKSRQKLWGIVTLRFAAPAAPIGGHWDADLAVKASFSRSDQLERLEWRASDGRHGISLAAGSTAATPPPEPPTLPWAEAGIEAMSPDGRTALVRRPLGAGFRLVARDVDDVVDLPVEQCSPAYSSAIFLRAGAAFIAGADHSPCTVDLTTTPPAVTVLPDMPVLSRQAVTPASLDRDGSLLAAPFRSERVDLIHTTDGRVATSLPMPIAQLAALAPDGSNVVVVGGGSTPKAQFVRVIDVAAGTSSRDLKRDLHVSAAAFNGQRVVLAFNGHVEVWRIPGPDGTWTMERVMLAPRYWSMAFVGGGRRLVAAATASVAAWDVDGWRQVLDLPIPSGRGAAFAADGSAVVTGAGFVDLPPLSQ